MLAVVRGKVFQWAATKLSPLAAVLILQTSCGSTAQLSAPEMVEAGEHWTLWLMGGPSVVSTDKDKPHVWLDCDQFRLTVNVRGLPPAQSFPQPPLKLTIGDTVWVAAPVAEMERDGAVLRAKHSMMDDVMRDKEALEALRDGARVQIDFQESSFTYPDIPSDMGKALADKCARLWQLP